MDYQFLALTIATAIGISTAILLAATGELLVEKVGVYNIALEGVMLVGALTGFITGQTTGSWVLGLVAGGVAGCVFALVFGFITVLLRTDMIVVGVALILVALGTTQTIGSSCAAEENFFLNIFQPSEAFSGCQESDVTFLILTKTLHLSPFGPNISAPNISAPIERQAERGRPTNRPPPFLAPSPKHHHCDRPHIRQDGESLTRYPPAHYLTDVTEHAQCPKEVRPNQNPKWLPAREEDDCKCDPTLARCDIARPTVDDT